MQLVIAEKPSVGRDLARALGVPKASSRASIDVADFVITWCIGHLVELDEPAAYDPSWKSWRLDTLPMIPASFRLRAVASTRDQLEHVTRLLRQDRFSEVINACDAGREGELIFRYVYDLAGARLPVRRLWVSSLTPEAIRAGFAALRPGRELDALADAARCRSEADWLVGMNATRAVTVRERRGHGKDSPLYSIGRVQTPTLAIIAERDRAIARFVPQAYWVVRGQFTTAGGETFSARWIHDEDQERLAAAPLADALVARARAAGDAPNAGPVVERIRQTRQREPAPQLFDLTSLQRTANRRWSSSASRTLELAQALYEQHKVLTYPRTDSRYLTSEIAATVPALWRALATQPTYAPHLAPLLASPPARSSRLVDDRKVSDHHAIIPTGKPPREAALSRDEARLYDLVVRRFIGAFYPDAEFATTELMVRVGPAGEGAAATLRARPPATRTMVPTAKANEPPPLNALPPRPDRFRARGRVRLVAGWQAVAGVDERPPTRPGEGRRETPEDDGQTSLPNLREGEPLTGAYEAQERSTRPPPHHTEASLLSAMEHAGRTIEDEALRDAMRERGLGTPATRAATIETLVKRGFIARDGKTLRVTPTGDALLRALPVPALASPELTGDWEARLARIAKGQETRARFMADIGRHVREIVDAIRNAPSGAPPPSGAREDAARGKLSSVAASPVAERRARAGSPPKAKRRLEPATPAELACPRCHRGHLIAGRRGWGCSRYREGCAFVVWFESDGHRLTVSELRDLVVKGKTRARKSPTGPRRWVLDVAAAPGQGAARPLA